MKIIEPSFELSMPFRSHMNMSDGIRILQFIEAQARISHRSEEAQTEDSWKRFIPAIVLKHGDWSVTEHASITATIRTDRGVTHELVRHRLGAYTQESTRFVRYNDELEFIMPVNLATLNNKNYKWEESIKSAECTYKALLGEGERPQEARSVLPNALAATIAVTYNLRNWRHFFLMRTSKETHPDFKRITIPMLAEFQKVIPLLYDDIIPEASQRANLEKGR